MTNTVSHTENLSKSQSDESRNGRPDEERNFLENGAGASQADAAPAACPAQEDASTDTPHARQAEQRLNEEDKHDQLAAKEEEAEDRQEALVDEGVEETFPASDPVSVKRIT